MSINAAPTLLWDELAAALQTQPDEAGASVWKQLQQAVAPIYARPRMVTTLEVAQQRTTHGKPYVVLRNTAQNTYLKLEPREYELVGLMDGTRTVQQLVVEYFMRSGALAVTHVTGLVQLLARNAFLTAAPRDVYAELDEKLRAPGVKERASRFVRGLVSSEFVIHDIDAPLTRLYKDVGCFFFTRPALVVGVLLSALGPLIYLEEFARGRYPLLQFGDSWLAAFALFFVFQFITLLIHELGHAMAVKRAGRFVSRGGFMLYYGFPAGFVDTTDIWMAPRRARLITSFAGPYTGLVLGGVCALGAFFWQGTAGALCFTWGFVLLINTLFNFNPLLELDGYYMLVDWLEKPSLRPRALNFVRGALWEKIRAREHFSREEIFFALFGIASLGYAVFAILLALQFWRLRLASLAGEALTGANIFAQSAVLLLGALLVIPLALALYAWGRKLFAQVATRLAVLNTRAEKLARREALDALRAIPLWQDLPEARQLEIARAMRMEDIATGTAVVRQGEAGDTFYIVAQGEFEVDVNGERVRRIVRGDYFGEMALLNHAPRNASVIALQPSRVFALDAKTFDALLARDLQTKKQLETAFAYRAEIAALPLFRELTPSELDLVLTKLQPQTVEAGAQIIRQGEQGDRFYIIRRGRVEVTQNGRYISTHGAGETFGEIALLYNIPRTATVCALEPTELLTLTATDFLDVLARYLKRAEALQDISQEHFRRYNALPASFE
ncbi:cyclic nucleotide-binding domain-containing protein [Anaerolineae bacterium CFX7]|nr:cyclic nucleotide-binding domain-containing protein [Anaerolineae bacterium CFX7]